MDRNIFEEFLNSIENKPADVVGNIILEGLIGLEATTKELRKKLEEEYRKKEENKKEENPQEKVVAVKIIDCDLKPSKNDPCGIKPNSIKLNDRQQLFEFTLSGFGNHNVINKKITTLRDKEGNKIAKVLKLELARDLDLDDNLFAIHQIPRYLKFEILFLNAKRIDRIILENGLLQIIVNY